MKKILVIVSVLLFSTSAFAQSGSVLVNTSEAVDAALVHFEKSSSAADVSLFKGVQASPKSGGVSVKVYLTNGTKLSYSCHRHEDTEPFECH